MGPEVSALGEAGDLADLAPTLKGTHQETEAIDVGIGVVPLPAGRPHGGDGAIPLLPGPEEVRGEPGPLRDHAHRVKDWVVTGLSHGVEYLDIDRSCQGIQ